MNMFGRVLLLALFTTTTATDSQYHLATSVSTICKRFLHSHLLLVVDSVSFQNNDGESLLKQLHELHKWSIMNQVSWTGRGSRNKAFSYLLLTTREEFPSQIARIHNHSSWNSRARVVVVLLEQGNEILEPEESKAEGPLMILHELSKRKVTKSIVLFPKKRQPKNRKSNQLAHFKNTTVFKQSSNNNDVILSPVETLPKHRKQMKFKRYNWPTTKIEDQSGGWDIFTWFPYQQQQCGKHVKDMVKLDHWDSGFKKFVKNADLFPHKIPFDLHGCPVTVSTFHWPPFIISTSNDSGPSDKPFWGMEMEVLGCQAQACNFTLNFSPTKLQSRWIGARKNVQLGLADLTVASNINNEMLTTHFDMTSSYMRNSVVWIVPRPHSIPRWRNLSRIFSRLSWFVCLLTLLLASITLWLLGRRDLRSAEPTAYRNMPAALSTAISVLLAISVPRQPKSVVLRGFFFLWSFYSLLINTAYQSSLISYLTQPGYEKPLTDVKQLLDSGLELGFADGYNIYLDQNDSVEAEIIKKLTFCTSENILCLNRVAYKADFAVLSDKSYVTFMSKQRYMDDNGRALLQSFPVNTLSYFVGMMMSKGHILLKRFNILIGRVNQAGLMTKWWSTVEGMVQTKKKYNRGTNQGPRQLSLSHLEGAFITLGFGMALGITAWIGELLAHWLLTKRRTNIKTCQISSGCAIETVLSQKRHPRYKKKT